MSLLPLFREPIHEVRRQCCTTMLSQPVGYRMFHETPFVVGEKGRIYVDGVYAGFEDDSFKVVYPPIPVDEQKFVSRQVGA